MSTVTQGSESAWRIIFLASISEKSDMAIALEQYGYPPVGPPTLGHMDRKYVNLTIESYLTMKIIINFILLSRILMINMSA